MNNGRSALGLVEDSLVYIVREKTKEVHPYGDMRFSDESELGKYDAKLGSKCGQKNFKIRNLLEDMCDMGLAVEERALDLNAELLGHQLIRHNFDQFSSLDFLAQTIAKKCLVPSTYEKGDISVDLQLPKWGVFGLSFNTNLISFAARGDFSSLYKFKDDGPSSGNYIECSHGFEGPKVLGEQLRKAVDSNIAGLGGDLRAGAKYLRAPSIRMNNLTASEIRRFGIDGDHTHEDYSFHTELNVEIPNKARLPIQKARKLFGDDNVFFIAERRPQDWIYTRNSSLFDIDPIVVGCHKKEGVFLVTKFDSTFEEARVVRDYVEKSE
jgi:hypothetical protein